LSDEKISVSAQKRLMGGALVKTFLTHVACKHEAKVVVAPNAGNFGTLLSKSFGCNLFLV